MASGSCQKICKLTVHQLLANCPLPNSQLTDVLQLLTPGGGWGDSAYEGGGDARRKVWIKPLKETDLGVAQAFFDP